VSGIGELRERSLHAAIKARYAREGDAVEARVGGFHIDILRPRAGDADMPLVIEIQTGSFASLRRKLAALLPAFRVRVVHPVAAQKWIVRQNAAGTTLSRRRSPRKAGVELAFRELAYIAPFAAQAGFALDVLLTQEEEVWRDDGQGSWRRRHWSIVDHRLLAVLDQIPLESPRDYLALLPPGLPEPFTTSDVAAGLRIARPIAGKMAYCLHVMGLLERTGRRGAAYLYRANPVASLAQTPGAGRPAQARDVDHP
jgi:hypothetical protein